MNQAPVPVLSGLELSSHSVPGIEFATKFDSSQNNPETGAEASTLGGSVTKAFGLDCLRVFAMIAVVLHHFLTQLQLEHWTPAKSLGQTAVACFCLLSGWLAAKTLENSRPNRWLFRRFLSIYPAFWIATSICVLGTFVSGYKPVSITLVVSQLAGTGRFTHGFDQLVNSSTWFVSLIVLCYGFSFLGAKLQKPLLWHIGGFLLGVWLYFSGFVGMLAIHFGTYCIGYLLRSQQLKAREHVVIAATMFLFAYSFPSYTYCSWAVAVFLIALRIQGVSRTISYLSSRSYYVYLCHGPILVALRLLVEKNGLPWLWLFALPCLLIACESLRTCALKFQAWIEDFLPPIVEPISLTRPRMESREIAVPSETLTPTTCS
jgi:peptidoglycan/LPS O-acetylase OafA/YrhL